MASGYEQLDQSLDNLSKLFWTATIDPTHYTALANKTSELAAQISLLKQWKTTAQYLRGLKNFADIPSLHYNISKFLEFLYVENDLNKPYQKLQTLNPSELIFVAITFTPTELSRLGKIKLNLLIKRLPKFLQEEDLPFRWAFDEAIRNAIKNQPHSEFKTSSSPSSLKATSNLNSIQF